MVQRRLNWLIFTILIWPYYWFRINLWWPLRKRPEKQIADIGRLIDLRPDYAPFYLRRAWFIAVTGEPLQQGFTDCEKVLQLNPAWDKSADFYVVRSRLHLANRDLDNALTDTDLAVKADRTSRVSYFLRAIVHAERRDYPLAIADYRTGLKYDFGMNRAQYAEVYGLIAEAYLNMQEYHKAQEELEKAARYSPDDLTVILGRVLVFTIQSNIDALNGEIAKIPPRKKAALSQAIGNRGYAHYLKGEYDRAVGDFDQAAALDPTQYLHCVNRSAAHVALGDTDTAIRDLRHAVELEAASPSAHVGLGFVHLLQGHLDMAEVEIEKALALRPGYSAALNAHAHLNLLRGDFTAALQDFEAAMKGYPQESTRISAMAGQAVAHYALNDADNIDTAIAQWRALCERHAARDLLVYLREQAVWPSHSLELAEQLNALTFP